MLILTKVDNTVHLCEILDNVFGYSKGQVCFNVFYYGTANRRRHARVFISNDQPKKMRVSLVVNGKTITKGLPTIIKFTTRFRKDITHNWAWLRIDIKEIKGDDSVD